MIDYAYDIKQAVTMEQVCEMYGIPVNRKGYAVCPFHAEKTGSMKIRETTFKCYGCGEHGDAIDFVRKYFNLDFEEAERKLSGDFHLGLSFDEELDDEKRRIIEERSRRRREQLRKRREVINRAQSVYDIALNKFAYLDQKRLKNAPTSPQEPISDEYADAVRRLPVAEYELSLAETKLYEIEKQRR